MLAVFAAAVLAAGPFDASAATPGDPLEKMNRFFYGGSSAVDRGILLPIARLYHKLTPGRIGEGIHNFLVNLGEPAVVANDILQTRMRRATDDLARLVTNTTLGLGGLIDVAETQGLPHHDNDFGVTLGRWGVGPGPYLFLPLLGPSDIRDAIGAGADSLASPFVWVKFPDRVVVGIVLEGVGVLDQRIRAEPQFNVLLSGAADPYATIRSVYLQSREAAIRGEAATPVLAPMEDDEPETTPPVGPPGAAPPAQPGAPAGPSAALPSPSAFAAPSADTTEVADDAPIATARPFDLGAPAPRLFADARD